MIGETISHYKILEELGRGGMGVVYKAEDTKLGRLVALKFLPADMTRDVEAKERFINEARATSALDHSNICTVHEIDDAGSERMFIAMAYYDGETLKERIARGPLRLEEAIDIAIHIGEGLTLAHESGIIHRDIKPANVMLTGRGDVKILDFGLSKLLGKTKLTREGTTLGTVDYMSPEQASGGAVDHRTDIWSLGVVLYAMAAGRLPFRGEYDHAVMYSIINTEPEPLTALRTDVPPELERIVDKCIRKDATERYQSAADLVADLRHLERAMAGREVTPAPLSKRFASKRRHRLLPLVVVTALAFFAVVMLYRHFGPAEKPAEKTSTTERMMLVVLPFGNLGAADDEYFADGITEEITSRLASLHGLGVISRTSALLYKGTNKTIRQIGEELDADYVLEGTVRWEKTADGTSRVRVTPQLIRVSDDTHIWTDQYDERLEGIFAVQSKIAENVATKLDVTLSGQERSRLLTKPTENMVAYQAYLKGLDYMKYHHSSKDNYLKAERMLEQAIGLDPGFALAYVNLSKANRCLYFYGHDRTEERLIKAKAAINKAIEIEPELPEVHLELGYYYYHGHLNYDGALEEFSIASRNMPNNTYLLADIAYIWRRQGLFDQAISNLEQAVSINPRDVTSIVELAYTYILTRKYDKGIQYCDESISIAPAGQWGYLVKAICYWCWTGDLEKSRAALEGNPAGRSPSSIYYWYLQEIYERNYKAALDRLPTAPGGVIEIQTNYNPVALLAGLAYYYMNDSLSARTSFESALVPLEKAVGERPDDPRVHGALGMTLAGLGRRNEAVRAGKRALELYPVSKDALLGTNRIMDLIITYALLGEYDPALDNIEHLLSIPSHCSIAYLNLWPSLDRLRETPGYQRLIRIYGNRNS